MKFQYEPERIYAEDETGKVIAEITFPVTDGIANIDRTFVDDSLRGQGIASELMTAAVDRIQKDGHRITAECSYAISWLSRHPEIETVGEKKPLACSVNTKH